MWVLFGFITFASFFTYNLHRRINGKWLGKKDITSDKKIEYDKSSSTSVNAKLLKKYSKYRRNTGTHYYLKILSSQKSYEIETDSHFFSAVKESGDICLRERSGFLGYRWISDISINKCL